MGECEMLRQEMGWRMEGAPGRDLSGFSEWREEADPRNLELLGIYGGFLIGQCSGMTDALSLEAVRETMDLLEIRQADRPVLTQRLMTLHSIFMERSRKKAKK